MKRVSLWSIAILLILLLYFVSTIVFSILFRELSDSQLLRTRTPAPTFTPTVPVETSPVETAVVVVAAEPLAPTATATSEPSPTPPPTEAPSVTPTDPPPPTATATPVLPQVTSATGVNIRMGPGTNYPVIGALLPEVTLPIIGRNESSTWWQVQPAEGGTGWVADSVVEASNTAGIPVVQAPPPPATPTPTPVPATPRPVYQYEPTGWYDDTNYGLTRFLGNISDVNGSPVNGVRVEAQCGSFRIVSNPSGPVGSGYFNESFDWPPGFYDITLDTRPIPCKWFLTVVETTPDGGTVTARLSEAVEVETTIDSSIIVANWRKNF